MGIALGLTGWWMYIDIPQTPQAVVVCVIIFNAAFGYRYGIHDAIVAAADLFEAGDRSRGSIRLR